MIKIYPDIFQETNLSTVFEDNNFPWYYHGATVDNPEFNTSNTKDTAFLSHAVFKEGNQHSNYFDQFKPLIVFFYDVTHSALMVDRCKVNLYLKDSGYPKNHYHCPHTDSLEEATTMLYFVNESDGPTYFFERDDKGLRIIHIQEPTKNTAVIFNSNIIHASSSPILSKNRITMNLVFKGTP